MTNIEQASKQSITPLVIISLFLGLTEIAMTVASTQFSGLAQVSMIVFAIAFPLLIAGLFFWTLWNRPFVLYPPTDYKETDVTTFVKAMQQKPDQEARTQSGNQETIMPGKTETKPEIPVEEKADLDIDKINKVSEIEPSSSEDLLWEMLRNLSSGNAEQAEEMLKRLQESENDDTKKQEFEAIYLGYRYRYGDSTALEKLKRLARQSETSIAHYWIGNSYEYVSNFDKAMEEYEISAQRSKGKDRTYIIEALARCLFKAGKQSEAYARIMHEIGQTIAPLEQSRLYESLASLYELAKDPELRALALEKAIESRPGNTHLLFDAGYSYSNSGFRALALLHYKTLLKFDADNTGALNNIGVQYMDLQMPMCAVESYKKASKLSDTLASANLAYRYINAGFEEEAREILDKAKQEEEPHQNVWMAISTLRQSKEAEAELEKKWLDTAIEQQRFLLSFAEAYFATKPDCPSFDGGWFLPDGTETTIAQSGANIKASWVYEKNKHNLTGHINNRAAKITIHEEGLFSKKERHGYAYLSLDGEQLFIMISKDKEYSYIELRRPDF